MIEVVRYTSDKKEEWDDFVGKSDIPVFMFYRDYMEYHKDRFVDYSLLVYENTKLKAILPAHVNKDQLVSHGGLTFGGIIKNSKVTYLQTVNYLNQINLYAHNNFLKTVYIKLTPSIYSETSDQSLSYILQRNKLPHSDLKLSTCINTKHHNFPKSSIEKRKLNLKHFNLGISDKYEEFWKILTDNLKKIHNTKPVHTINEILYLQRLFPKNILLYTVINKETKEINAGAVLYKFKNVLKLQYLSASEEGRKNRASHALYYSFINHFKNEVDYIDLGNCMEDKNEINTSLLYIKERFGAKVYPMCEYEISSSSVCI
ncbi:hypothetical protein [Saccharicrinis aurantiacus]|uniref:hypothetical protein n=1 Tax=Saccharicrinis aurantiacus TaxID=1849719 RepID=UPI0024916EC9|nr:hypothetical protein [Saccharicrinis aurantiacus]